ncbi:hypothetical protein [Bradymonas sediminis]|uniref:Uncharacterized protein n=1 Tax=Bradymonas sediminis TaxID=1548548 RepID=A0A2Z4FHA0_9DELT|nr:hypothetical protein [Bradymonas sediminis]AWV88372.1 hypothetical protein DN745_03040 [Bradymonas sediminis]TDP77499.1 hypothetical protein DFR33_101401 [Bradymonas sediminis]
MKTIAVSAALSFLVLASTSAFASDNADTEPSIDGLHIYSAFGLRAIPLGAKLDLNAGYRLGLSDSDSVLLKDTYIEAGVTTISSPSSFWGGAYIEALPVAVLKLRATAQSMTHFGTFGYLHLPTDPDQSDWSLDALDKPISSGTPGQGYVLEGAATLQAKFGNFVAMVPAKYSYVSMDVDRAYYETNFDFLLEPTDQVWQIEPTLGYVFVMKEHDSWVLTGFRWQHAETVKSALSRDMPTLLGMWKLPGKPTGAEMKLVGLGGYWLNHTNREDTLYFAAQLAADWRF